MKLTARYAALLILALALLVTRAPSIAQTIPPSPTPSPSPSPSPFNVRSLLAQVSPLPSQSPSPSPSATPVEAPLYDMVDNFYTIDRSTTLFYYFQGNTDGSGKVKQEIRYGRNLWTKPAQLKIRIPVITKFPLVGTPYSGFGNLELGYSYGLTSPTFDHTLEFRGAFNTNANNVDNHDTEIKAFYVVKWKWKTGALSYKNEYDQSVIVPANGTWTSYYEGEWQVPDVVLSAKNPSLKLSVLNYSRVLFDTRGGFFKDAIGFTLFGGTDDTSFLITDTWGIGGINSLWRYKFEANFTARF